MKKYYSVFIILFSSAVILGCKKNDPAKEKDYAASIKDKTWWGKLTNAGETAQHYCVHFNADKTLTWSQLSGDYTGIWSLDGNKITLNFTSLAVVVTADVTADDKLANITTNTANKINSGEMMAKPNAVLNNTIWKGVQTDLSGTTATVQLIFLPADKCNPIYSNVNYGSRGYTRSQSNGVIRFDMDPGFHFFGFTISDTEMRGTYYNYKSAWQLTKQ